MKKILYFSAPWCGPCKTLSPTMDQLSAEGLHIQKIDVDTNPELSTKYSIRSVPCLVLVDNLGNTIKKLVGNQPAQTIKNWYNN
jgi:thioredoxin-like negative regulator of GroEL